MNVYRKESICEIPIILGDGIYIYKYKNWNIKLLN